MKDIDLLYKDPDKLIEKYQSTIDIIINKYIKSGYINFAYKDDLKQDVNEELILKIPKIVVQYNSKYSLSTYISAIIRNICLEKIRKIQTFAKKAETELVIDQITYNSAPGNLAITDELERLKLILMLFGKQKAKLELCLKLVFRVPVNEEDIYNYMVNSSLGDLQDKITILNNEHSLTDNQLYNIITDIFNEQENKSNHPDAIRKWIKFKIDEVIYLMNGNPKRAQYDKESFKHLVELFYNKKDEKYSIQHT
jgi:RNA polymerase sigma factor (sigma-70 family)